MTWDWSFVWQILPELLRGLWVTVLAVVLGMLVALTLGLAWAVARRSTARIVSWPAAGVVEFVRSTPLLIQLYFAYYVLPDLGIVLAPWVVGVIALGVHFSTYTSEVYRAGIDGIPQGQWLAARALNLNKVQTYRHVIIPQAIPPVIPALGNYLLAMFKITPLLSAITVLEVLQRAKNLGNEHFRYLEPLTIVGLMYLLLSLAAGSMVSWLEQHFATES